jgi:hypothetical protein
MDTQVTVRTTAKILQVIWSCATIKQLINYMTVVGDWISRQKLKDFGTIANVRTIASYMLQKYDQMIGDTYSYHSSIWLLRAYYVKLMLL